MRPRVGRFFHANASRSASSCRTDVSEAMLAQRTVDGGSPVDAALSAVSATTKRSLADESLLKIYN